MELDEKTFKELIHNHRDLIWRICSCYRLNAAWTTEDAFHEVLCNLWKGFGSFDKRSTERTWIFRVATNTMISLARITSNQQAAQQTDYQEPSYNNEHYHDLMGMIEALPEPNRTIVNAHIQGFSYAEIAKITGLTIAAVAMRLSRTLRKLQKQYNSK